MERSDTEGERCESGGIISLAEFCEEHAEALEYDLMTRTSYLLDDAGGALPWRSLYSFIKNLGGDSALARDLGKSTGWDHTLKTNEILADRYDLLQVVNANVINYATHGKKKAKVTPYPRPGREDDKKKRIGSGAVPITDLREWIRRKQAHGRKD